MFQTLCCNLVQEFDRLPRSITFAQVPAGVDGLPGIALVSESSNTCICFATMPGEEDAGKIVAITTACHKPDSIFLCDAAAAVQRLQDLQQAFESWRLNVCVNTVFPKQGAGFLPGSSSFLLDNECGAAFIPDTFFFQPGLCGSSAFGKLNSFATLGFGYFHLAQARSLLAFFTPTQIGRASCRERV